VEDLAASHAGDAMKKIVVSLSIAIMPILLTGLAYAIHSGGVSRQWRKITRSEPAIEFPQGIDLGHCERGHGALGYFTIANSGGAALAIDDIRSSCGCMGVEREIDGRFFRVQALRLESGEEVALAVRISVDGKPGTATHALITFRTNDPAHPQAEMEVTAMVKGGVVCLPAFVDFGALPQDQATRTVVEIYDDAENPRRIDKVVSSLGSGFAARILPLSATEREKSDGESRRLVGKIEISAAATDIGSLDGQLQIYLAGEDRTPDSLMVRGRVIGVMEASPSTVVLPRHSSAGMLYYADVSFRSADAKPLSLTVESVTHGLTVRGLPGGDNGGTQKMRIEWHPEKDGSAALEDSKLVRIRGRVGGAESVVPIRVHVVAGMGKDRQ
jgi:hypothetical protein